MNERIKELMIEAGKTISGDKHIDADFCERFAELIIKECGDVADDYVEHGIPSAAIDKHFGIKP
jgi:hypothetical protein